jgi:hypothetical protein
MAKKLDERKERKCFAGNLAGSHCNIIMMVMLVDLSF